MAKEDSRKLNKKMLERIIIMHNLIKSKVYPNISQIRRHYLEETGYDELGDATIYRDLNTLKVQFHAPLEFDRQKNGYYYFDDKWEFALNNISEKDIFYLSSAKTLLSNFSGTPIYDEIAGVIDFITDTQMAGKSSLLNRIAIPPAPKVVINSENWNIIMQALQKNEVIEFDYNGRWRTSTTHRKVRPYQILLDEGMYFLFGWDENAANDTANSDGGKSATTAGGERLFCINRIKNLKATGIKFELPEYCDFTSRCSGGKFGAFMESYTTQYEIDFYASARQYVKDCIWADDQEITDKDAEDTTTIKFTSSQSLKVMEWVLAQGMKAKPVAPESFVEWWKEEIRGMMENAGL